MYFKKQFKRELGYNPDLKQPSTFNEKLQRLKLHLSTTLHTICAYKFVIRNFISEQIGEEFLITILQTCTPSELHQDNLPNKLFIIKATHHREKI